MDNNVIQVFESSEFGTVRVLHVNGQPWWVLKDVCLVLGIGNTTDTAKRLDEDEKATFDSIESLRKDTVYISESGLYAVILRSDKPNARAFRKWVTSKVLPAIRKHGAYISEDILRRMQEDSEYNAELLRSLTAERGRNTALVGRVARLAPKAHYHDIILQCPDAVQVSIIAKDYGQSAVAFNKLLHKLGVQFRIGKTWLLYKAHQGNGYTVTNTYTKNGMTTMIHTLWTQQGRYWLYELLKSRGILPEAEKMAHGGQMSLADINAEYCTNTSAGA